MSTATAYGSAGLGCMGMSGVYGPADEKESVATIHAALDGGVTLLDTADMYGPFTNEELIGEAIRGRRDQVVLATKFSLVNGPYMSAVSSRSTPPSRAAWIVATDSASSPVP